MDADADRCFPTQRHKKTTKRKNKQQQGKSNKKLHQGRRNKKQKRQLSNQQLQHMNSLNEQIEDRQPLEFQLNRGNQSSESNRLQHQKNNRGLSKKKLNMLPKINADSQHVGDDCTICLMEYKKKQPLLKLHCGHVLHIECGRKWLKIAATCPICRRDQWKLQWFYKNKSSATFRKFVWNMFTKLLLNC